MLKHSGNAEIWPRLMAGLLQEMPESEITNKKIYPRMVLTWKGGSNNLVNKRFLFCKAGAQQQLAFQSV